MNTPSSLSNLSESKQILTQTIGIGATTLESLRTQAETLDTIEDTLDAHTNVLDKTMRTLRSMEWFGRITSLLDFSTGTNSHTSAHEQIGNSVIPINNNLSNTSNPNTHNSSSNFIINQQDTDLDAIGEALGQLHQISTSMHSHLISNQETLDRVNNKTDKVNEMTLACILKSAKISNSQSTLFGYFEFVDVVTGKFLAVENNYLILTDKSNLTSQFACKISQSGLIGISNVSTLKYIGTTLLGSIKVAEEYWGRMENCFMDLSGQPTGIFVLARNWGSGAWIKTGTNYLTDSTTGIHDKKSMLVVRARKLPNPNSK